MRIKNKDAFTFVKNTTHVGTSNNVRKVAFTLAEVLITLGIIGVVAALTIPTLINNYQTKSWNTAADVFEKKIEQSLRVMNVQSKLSGYKTTEDFVEELEKHMKINKVCGNDEIASCFSKKVYWGSDEEEVNMSTIKLSAHFGQKGWGTNLVGIQFANGVSGVLGYNPNCKQNPFSNEVTGLECVSLLYDISGNSEPNTSSKDLRSINVLGLNGKNCVIELGDYCFSMIQTVPTGMTYQECEEKKSTLGFNYCLNGAGNVDRWAKAVEMCGGVKYMPTSKHLLELAKYFYENENISGYGSSGLSLNFDRVAEFGLNLPNESYFWLWTNEEMDGNTCLGSVCTAAFWSDKFITRGGNHSNSDRRVICVSN